MECDTKPKIVESKMCNSCSSTKPIECFIQFRNKCKDCNNKSRREKYSSNETLRLKIIKQASDFKHAKVLENQKLRESRQIEIGETNKQCKYCEEIKPATRFRRNRLKCKDCERDEPLEKFKRTIRTRIYNSLMRKTKHSIEYLGCGYNEFSSWIFGINPEYTLENHGEIWHIDHVIPLSKFNLEDESQQLIAFNWRNTTALSVYENLSKNNKVIELQIRSHYRQLTDHHTKFNIDFPEKYIELFAKHLVAGIPLEP
jgi:hypothetical protein